MKKKKVKIKFKNLILFLFCFIFFGIFLYSLLNIIDWNKSNKDSKKIKEDINDTIIKGDKDNIKVDFEKLKSENPDTVAYIKINNTNIDYVVVKGKDNDYYLDHNFSKKYNKTGWIFMNYVNNLDGSDKNISIFGHNRLDGSMFGSLKKTLTKQWQENKDNHEILFITENHESKYQVFSTYKIKTEDYYIKSDFTDNEFSEFVETIKKRSNYDYNVDVDSNSQIITLSTCDINNDYRVVLHAKKLE